MPPSRPTTLVPFPWGDAPSHSWLRAGRLSGCDLQLSVTAWTGFNTLRTNILLLLNFSTAEEPNINRAMK